ncbi:hypothetical protein E4U60_006704 [Claviceps pazoutovae]|nr:hypothetical protein E4U60_006704 [Claviceps pazoutovae]
MSMRTKRPDSLQEKPARGPRVSDIRSFFKLRPKSPTTTAEMAQTLEQRRRNAKFAKEQESRMGKAEEQIKKRVKETHKSPISPIWIGVLGFIIFGGLLFEALSRMFA